MSGNTFGNLFAVTNFGESHGPAIGCVIDGCPPGMSLAEADIQPGEAILFVLVKKVTGDKVLEGIKGVGGRILQTSLDHTREEALRKALEGDATAPPPSA